MKKIFLLISLFALFSCEKDFIELAPEGQQSSATFFQTEDHFRQAITAAYDPLRGLVQNEYFMNEMRSDNTHYELSVIRGTAYEMRDNLANFVNAPNNNYVYAVYRMSYLGISRANMVLDRIRDSNISQAAKNDIGGQAKFLRAFYYFKLVRYFGEVPLHLTEVTTADEAFAPRSSVENVYSQIIADAQEAIEMLAPPEGFPQSGEATKGAASMLLAEVYMEQERYSEAETLLKTLPDIGYELLPDYASVFSTANKNSRESIFEVQYMMGLQGGQQSNFIYRFLPRTTNTSIITEVNTNNTGFGGYNIPTQDLINAYEPGDTRLDASIGIAEGTYNSNRYLSITSSKSIVDYTPEPGQIGVPYIKKYLNPHTDPNNTDDNWPVYRYADALLLLAEALNEQGKSGEALTYVNQVRARAFENNDDAMISTADQMELRKIIAHERRVELAFENRRWHDLVRTGKAIEVMTIYGNDLKNQYDYLGPNTYQVNQENLLYPIPSQEVELNPDLSSNSEY